MSVLERLGFLLAQQGYLGDGAGIHGGFARLRHRAVHRVHLQQLFRDVEVAFVDVIFRVGVQIFEDVAVFRADLAPEALGVFHDGIVVAADTAAAPAATTDIHVFVVVRTGVRGVDIVVVVVCRRLFRGGRRSFVGFVADGRFALSFSLAFGVLPGIFVVGTVVYRRTARIPAHFHGQTKNVFAAEKCD